jgi:hypothetical protein
VYASSPDDENVQPPVAISANAHQVTGSGRFGESAEYQAVALAGVGLLVDVPVTNQTLTSTSTQAVYVYGAGLDVGLISHFGLRLQYRGNLNKDPDLTEVFTSTDEFMHTAEPMAGLYARF